MKYLQFIFFCLIFSGMSNFIVAQDIITMDTSSVGKGKTVYTCNGLFSPERNIHSGNYFNNQNAWVTICPEQREVPGSGIKIEFKRFQVRQSHDPEGPHNDTLLLFDGPDTLSRRLFIGGRSYLSHIDNPAPIDSTIYATNPSGCFTFQFKSDANIVGKGWEIEIGCRLPVQPIDVSFGNSYFIIDKQTGKQVSHNFRMERGGADDTNTYTYLDLCERDSFLIKAKILFPKNEQYYPQNINNCKMEWRFGNQILSKQGTSGTSASYQYKSSKAYHLSLKVSDQEENSSTKVVRVRIATNPLKEISPLPDICTGQEFWLRLNTQKSTTTASSFTVEKSTDTLFIPDKIERLADKPACIKSRIAFSGYNDTYLQSASDINALCVQLEHSFLGDLELKLTCPNGQSTYLKKDLFWGDQVTAYRLGIPYGGNNYYQYQSDGGPDSNYQGVYWPYCWSENEIYSRNKRPVMSRLLQGQFKKTVSFPNEGWETLTDLLDSSDYKGRSGFFSPAESFEALVGCPLNGDWTLEICDHFFKDNGWLGGWFLEFNPDSLPVWEYTVKPASVLWSGSGVRTQSPVSALVKQKTEGEHLYSIQVKDKLGCKWDTSLYQTVIPSLPPTISGSRKVKTDQSVILNAGKGYESYLWNTGDTTQTLTIESTGIGMGTDTFWVEVSKPGYCTRRDSVQIIFTDQLESIIPINRNPYILFPNPSNGDIQMVFQKPERREITVTDIKGNTVYKKYHTESVIHLDLCFLPEGIYCVITNHRHPVNIIIQR